MGLKEKYLEKKKDGKVLTGVYNSIEHENMEERGYQAYSPEEYDNILESRNQNEFVSAQKSYYFEDTQLLHSKAARYRKLSEDKNGEVDMFAGKHDNRSAKKRKKSAAAAAEKYEKAEELEKKFRRDLEAKPDMSAYDQYTYECKIMKLHLEGRIEAAKAKATSEDNADYRIAKAKYSCTFALLNQLNLLLKKDPGNKKLLKDQATLTRQIEKYRDDFKKQSEKNAPKKKAQPAAPGQAKELRLDNAKKGFRRLDLMKKEHILQEGDKKRISEKDYYFEAAKEDMLRDDLTADEIELLTDIRDYGDIHTTVSHYTSSKELYWKASRWSDGKFEKKMDRQKQKLDKERKLLVNIRSNLSKLLSSEDCPHRDMLEKYQRRLDDMARGTLIVDESKVLNFSDGFKCVNSYIENAKKRKQQKKANLPIDPAILKKDKLELEDRKNEPLFSHEPCSQDVVQTNFGDCYFMSVLGEIAGMDGNMIREMMKDEGDTVTVRFFHEEKNAGNVPVFIRVSKEVPKDDGGRDTLWVKLMEKAYAVFLQQYRTDTHFDTDEQDEIIKQQTLKNDEIEYGFMSHGGKEPQVYDHLCNLQVKKSFDLEALDKRQHQEDTKNPAQLMKRLFVLEQNHTQINDEFEEIKELEKERNEMRNANAIANVIAQKDKKIDEHREKLWAPVSSSEFAVLEDGTVFFKEIYNRIEQEAPGFDAEYQNVIGPIKAEYDAHKAQRDQAVKQMEDLIQKKLEAEGIPELEKEALDIEQKADQKMEEYKISALKAIDLRKDWKKKQEENKKLADEALAEKALADEALAEQAYKDEDAKSQMLMQEYMALSLEYEAKKKLLDEKKNTAEETVKKETAWQDLRNEQTRQENEMRDTRYEKWEEKKKNNEIIRSGKDLEKIKLAKKQMKSIQEFSGTLLQKILKEKLNKEDLSNGLAAKKEYEDILNHLESFTLADCKKAALNAERLLYYLKESTTIQDEEKIYELVKEYTRLMLEKIISNMDNLFSPENTVAFSGTYSVEALEVFEEIKAAGEQKRFITASTRDFEGDDSKGHHGEKMSGGLAGTHAYSCYGAETFTLNGKEIRMIKLRNPWGVNVPVYQWDEKKKEFSSVESVEKSNGTFYCELTHFVQYFSDVNSIEKNP